MFTIDLQQGKTAEPETQGRERTGCGDGACGCRQEAPKPEPEKFSCCGGGGCCGAEDWSE